MAKYCPYCVSRIEFGNVCPHCSYANTYRPRPEHLKPGTLLHNKYLIGRVLGQGGFGITYLGRDLLLDMRVAIKEYFPRNVAARNTTGGNTQISLFDWSNSGMFGAGKEQFIQEAQTIAKMDKESAVVSVRDFFEENNSAYIVMEYVDGEDLRSIMLKQGKAMESTELLPLLEPVFDALDELHGIGLIHRDISPDNLMIEDGRARLIDFGCARATAAGTEDEEGALKHGFSPIEQYENRNMGPWTDVYAMAATIYYCLTGRLVPKATERVLHDTLAHPIACGAKITPRQDKALMRALSVQPESRYPSIAAFGKDLFLHRNKSRFIAVASCILAVAVITTAVHFLRDEVVDTRAKETEKHEMLSESELSKEERQKLEQLTVLISQTEMLPSEKGTYWCDIRLKNTTDYDLDSLQLQVRTFDSSGVELSNRRSSTIDLKKDGEETVSIYLGATDFEKAEIKARLLLGERSFETAYCQLSANTSAQNTGVSITLRDELPATYKTQDWRDSYQYTITDFSFKASSYQNGYYVTVLLSGTYDSGPDDSSASLTYLLMDKDGKAVNEGSSQTVSFPKLRPGDNFERTSLTIWNVPEGEYTLVLEGKKS